MGFNRQAGWRLRRAVRWATSAALVTASLAVLAVAVFGSGPVGIGSVGSGLVGDEDAAAPASERLADLAARAVTVEAGTRHHWIVVQNVGAARSPQTQVRHTLAWEGAAPTDFVTPVPPLAPGQQWTVASPRWPAAFDGRGAPSTILWKIDEGDAARESDETNNDGAVPVTGR